MLEKHRKDIQRKLNLLTTINQTNELNNSLEMLQKNISNIQARTKDLQHVLQEYNQLTTEEETNKLNETLIILQTNISKQQNFINLLLHTPPPQKGSYFRYANNYFCSKS